MRVPRVWGASAGEMAEPYACDRFVEEPFEGWFRAVSVQAAAATVFRWLCQLKVAPYSYDILDNAGRRSPRKLTPGVERLERGQRVMSIFELVDFAPDRHLTLRMTDARAAAVYGRLAVSYTVREHRPGQSRLVVKLAVPNAGLGRHAVLRPLLAWGDLAMMRRQLHTLRDLAAAS
ncbi:hypothetical protein ACWENQ_08050 [Nonomuraea sp. NPDC004354]